MHVLLRSHCAVSDALRQVAFAKRQPLSIHEGHEGARRNPLFAVDFSIDARRQLVSGCTSVSRAFTSVVREITRDCVCWVDCLKQDLLDFLGFSGCLGSAGTGVLVQAFTRDHERLCVSCALSEAEFAGFLGIFRFAGDRLMAGRRILFAAGERTDCRGTVIRDARVKSGLSQIF